MEKIRNILKNKVILYFFTINFSFVIKFIVSMIVADKLGPYYFGIWSFLLLMLNYFQVINFGIYNSVNILLVQKKNSSFESNKIIVNASLLISILSFVIILIGVYYYFFGINSIDKFNVDKLFYFVIGIAILVHFDQLFMTVYRISNKLFEIGFYQVIIPLLTLIPIFFYAERNLLIALLITYLFGYLLSMFLFIFGGKISFRGTINFESMLNIVKKGFYLFIYNLCFYLIIISIRSIVSMKYSVEDFGYFSFAYTIANSILLLLEAFLFIVFPKIIDKFNSDDPDQVNSTISMLQVNYVTLSHFLVYLALIFIPLLISFLPDFSSTVIPISLLALSILPYTHTFSYNSYLMAKNKEKLVAFISFFSLLFNFLVAFSISYLFDLSYYYISFAIMASYILFTCLSIYYGSKILNVKRSFLEILNICFPLRLAIPYGFGILVCLLNVKSSTLFNIFISVPILLFVALNKKQFFEIIDTVRTIIIKPKIVDIS